MDLIKTISTNSINFEDNTKLLFYENYKYEKTQYNVEEIFFGKAILLQQIRILRADSNPHPKIKSVQSITQTAPIHNFEIFCRNLKKYSDKFECILENSTINESSGANDCIFPFLTEFVTNHIIIRGMYEKITICIYGVPYIGTEGHLLLETAKNDVPLEKLQYTLNDLYEDGPLDKINFTNDDIELLNTYTLDSLISPYIKCEVLGAIKRAYYINPPDVNMVEKTKTGYIYYENDLNYYSQCLFNFYLTLSLNENKSNKTSTKGNSIKTESKYFKTLNSNRETVSDEITLQSYFKKISDILKILISKNYAFLEQDCIFRKDNEEIFNKIPESLVEIIIFALNGNQYGYSEIKSGLKLLKILTNSSRLIEIFIDKGGMDLLYNLILRERKDGEYEREGSNVNYSTYASTFTDSNSLILNTLTLDIIYRLLTYKKAFNKFMENTDKSKSTHRYFMIRENTKEEFTESSVSATIKAANEKDLTVSNFSGSSKKKEKLAEREREKDRNKKKSKREKRSKRDKKSSRSTSRSKSKERERSYSRASVASDYSNKFRTGKKKTQAKNILLKNGYQIILTLLVGKKNNIIVNMVKKIVNKITLILHMKELKNFTDMINKVNNNFELTFINKISEEENSIQTLRLYFDKLPKMIEKIFEYFSKLDIPYKISSPKENTGIFSDYPYKNFWIDYIKIGRKFFKKSDNFNLKSTIESLSNSSTSLTEFKVITNEEAILLEENLFVESLLSVLTFEKFQETKYYTEFALNSKNFITYILLSKGGINFFSKNFELTMILRHFLNTTTDDLINDKDLLNLTNEENFFSAIVRPETCLLSNKSLNEHTLYSQINQTLMKTGSKVEMSEDFIIKINFLQLRYLLEISFVFLSKFDDFIMFKLEESKLEDFIDKSLDIFLLFSQNINRSNLSKQAFIALFNNEYFIEEIISQLNNYLENEPQEYEAHLTLIFEILMCVFSNINKNTDLILIEYGSSLYDVMNKLKQKMQNVYDNTENDPVNKDFFYKFETLINFLEPTKIFSENKEIKSLMQYVNDCLFNNVQKYNLNEKPINEDNLKEENIREYVKGLKLNILNYHNSDVDYLDTLKKKNSLINELFVAVKLINLSIRINPLLLIDCVSDHIHLALRYLIVNTVNCLKCLLSTETVEYQENAKSDLEIEKYARIKDYSVLLTHLYNILSILLEHLLSSHVDNYRDNIVIDNTVNLLIILINYLFNTYSQDETAPNNLNLQNYSHINSSIVEDLQKLFASVLNAFKEICKFNTTIKLNFEKIMEKISERPSNKGPMIYIFNFMFGIINNEYTIETFVEHFMKIQKPISIDIFSELESNSKHPAIKIAHLNEDKNFIQYIIEIGINTNNDWIMNNCANLLISIQRAYRDKSKINLYEHISDQILSAINSAFNKINKVDLSIIEEKEIPNFLNSIDLISRITKFLLIFLKSEFKFLYIFHDISNIYLKITSHFKEYLGKTLLKPNFKSNLEASGNINKLANKVLDILNILLDSFVVICDNKIGFDSIIHEEINNDMHYDIVEELPNKNEIVSILKETKTFLIIDNLLELENNSDLTIFNKFLNLTLKSVKIFEKLSQNFYGQIIILYSDYPINNVIKTKNSKPIFVFNDLIRGILYRLNSDNKNCLSQDILIEILDCLVITVIMLTFDLNYFKLNDQNKISRFEMIRLNRIYLPAEEKNFLNLLITQTRLSSLIQFLIGEEILSREEAVRNISELFTQVYEAIAEKNSFFNLNNESKFDFNLSMMRKITSNLLHNVSIIANLFSDYSYFRFIDNENSLDSDSIQLVKLPNARKIYEKLEIIYKFFEFINTQNYSYDVPFSISNSLVLNPQTQMTNPMMIIKQNINDFEKLLNWKKYRIYLSKSNNLITRTNLFELDPCLKLTPEEYLGNSSLDLCLLTESLPYKKKFTYLNVESFQQFYNQMLNESLLLEKFANISYSITSSVVHKFSVYSSCDYYNSEMINLSYRNMINLKVDVEFLKIKTGMRDIQTGLSKIKSGGIITPLLRTKKRINSKFNTFIYKPKFDKMPKPLLNTPVSTSSSISIRDTNRYASVVSGRTLSVHMDKFNPTQNVVNPTYASIEETPKETQLQSEMVEKEISIEESRSEGSKKEEIVEKIVIESKIANLTTNQQVSTEPKTFLVTNPQLTFDNRVMENQLQTNTIAVAVQNKIEATKINNMSANVINPQLNLRMVSPMSNYGQSYVNMMNPSLNINMQGGMPMTNQMQTNQNPNQPIQFNPFQMNQQGMNPNLMIGQPNQMSYNYSNIRQPVNPININPQMNQIYNQNIAMMNKNMMNYNQMTGQSHFNYNQINHFQNQQHHQQSNQMMKINTYGQNVQNVNPSLNMDFSRMNQQQTVTSVQNLQLEERKNVITPSTQNSSSGNTNIISNILQVLQNPDLKQMLGKFSQPQSQGSVDDKSKDPRIRKKK